MLNGSQGKAAKFADRRVLRACCTRPCHRVPPRPASLSTPAMNDLVSRTGARLLVDALSGWGVTRSFGVPGESYLAVLDALRDSGIGFTVCRQEGGAAMMAEAVGKLTGRPGVCFVTRGPGAANAMAGLHVARQDSTPMILFVGQVARPFRQREAFQELDYGAVFGGVAKWAAEIDEAARVPEFVARAMRTAMQGRPGPVVLALPEDMLTETATVPDAPVGPIAEPWPDPDAMARFGRMLTEVQRPMVLLGGGGWTAEAAGAMADLAARWRLPVAVTFRRQMLFPADHPGYAGDLGIGPNPALVRRIKEADLILLLGGRLGEMPSQSYELLGVPDPGVPLVHVHPGAEELGRVYQPALAIQAAPGAFLAAWRVLAPPADPAWAEGTAAAHAAYRAWSDTVPPHPGALQMAAVVDWLRALPPEAIVCNGAGNYAGWIHRFHRFRRFGTQLAPTSGSMGYGVPAAVAAKLLRPDQPVVAFAGDGCFLMTGQEFATAVQYDLPIVVVVVDNGMYGTIRMHQEREHPGRVFGTDLRNPDFAAYARAFGGEGFTATTTAEVRPALNAALACGRPAIVHLRLDPDAITPATTLTAIRAKALGG